MACYYKEMFGLGMLSTLFIFGAVFLWWDEIEILFKKIIIIMNKSINKGSFIKEREDKQWNLML
ncbi:MAG: hypothetical protein NTZ83_04585 [Candidatus Pacearchaeota archaeon]|nr:hypothetical protein [Candidatus Pacearchaeota archaeon]